MYNYPEFYNQIFFKRFEIEIKFKEDIHFRFFHGYKLYDFLCKAIGFNVNKLGKELVIDPVESGRIYYKRGENYKFGLLKLNPSANYYEFLFNRINKLSRFNAKNDSLWGKYELIKITEIEEQIPTFPETVKKIEFQFITPLRMLRRKNDQKPHLKYFSKGYFDLSQFNLLFSSRIASLSNAKITPDDLKKSLPQNTEYRITGKSLMWCDMYYQSTSIGGVIGNVTVEGTFKKDYLAMLWLGQILFAGNNTSHGFGKYRLNYPDNFKPIEVLPSETFLQKMLKPKVLLDAVYKVKSKLEENNDTLVEINDVENSLNNYKAFIQPLINNQYIPSNINGFLIPKNNDPVKKRAIAVPSVKDRVLQRAAAEVLYNTVDHFLEDFSFAYRKGFSRKNAAETIERYHKKGYKYFLKVDIEAFFDSVDWNILDKKLNTLFYNDPIVLLLDKWIKQDVIYRNKRIKRNAGLIQGMAISPLLANLYLDEFDDMLKDNFKIIRYSDDLVVMCKSKSAALKAVQEAKNQLENLKLKLNDEKTVVSSLSEGLSYLGYLFIDCEILERRKDNEYSVTEVDLFRSKASWLCSVESNEIEEYRPEQPNVYEVYNKNGETNENVKPVYITGKYKAVISSNFLVISSFSDNDDTVKVPLHTISSVCFLGSPASSLHTILKMNELNKPVYFLKRNGEIYSSMGIKPDYNLWMKQIELRNNSEFCIKFAKKIVSAKITNSKVLSKRYKWHNTIIEEYNSYLYALRKTDTIEQIMGFEGVAAKLFFAAMRAAIPSEWNFSGRVKHPPVDPVNAMLSFGYTILYKHISSAIYMNGLNPEIGIYHSLKKGHNALASDLVEEFRFIIDSVVLYIIHRNMVNLNDFEIIGESKNICTMKTDFLKKYVAVIEERLRHQHKLEGFENTFLGSFYDKANLILNIVKGNSQDYKPTLIRV